MSSHGAGSKATVKEEPHEEAEPTNQGEAARPKSAAGRRVRNTSYNRSQRGILNLKIAQLKKSQTYKKLPAEKQQAWLSAKLQLYAETQQSTASSSASVSDASRVSARAHAADLSDGFLNKRMERRLGESHADVLARLEETHAELEARNEQLQAELDFHAHDREEAEACLSFLCSAQCNVRSIRACLVRFRRRAQLHFHVMV